MRIHPGLMLAAIAQSAVLAAPSSQPLVSAVTEPGYTYGVVRRRSIPVGHAQGQRRLRSRWKAERPKRSTNRMRISKRTRRKHRRAA